jgi:hypothetical protein
MSFVMTMVTVVINAALAKRTTTSTGNPAPTPPPIVSISVCSSDSKSGTLDQGSCGTGLFDTHQIVRSPEGISINEYVQGGVSDEHQSIFAPGKLNGNSDYLFFVASRTNLNDDTGLLVLSGVPGKEPDPNKQWTLQFATDYGYYPSATPCATASASPTSSPVSYAAIFLSPSGSGCPNVIDVQSSPDPRHQDQTFDLNYAAPGSIVFDPTSSAGSLLMIYEGTNTCFGTTGGPRSTGFYSSVGVATSLDYGRHWPTYHDNSSFAFVPLPCQNTTAGPNAWGMATATPNGAVGPGEVYEGNLTQLTPPSNYGRYAVLSPTKSIAQAMALGTPIPGGAMGDAEMSAFLDDVSGSVSPYVYTIYNDNLGSGPLADPNEIGGLSIARAQLNGGAARLSFEKWNQGWVSSPGVGGYDSPIFPNNGPAYNCLAPNQKRFGGSLSYVEATHQYLLTFVCLSPGDPATCAPCDLSCLQGSTISTGGAWFYATSDDPSQPELWSAPDPLGNAQPQEIKGSYSDFVPSPCNPSPDFKGFYPTFMSLDSNPGHLSTSGYVFYLFGCQTSDSTRRYSSREFKITTTDTAPPVTTASVAGPLGANDWYVGSTTVTFSATDDLSGIAQTQYSLDNGTSWTTGTSVSLSADGIYNIQYQSIDVDGNVEAPKSITVNLDSKAPAITESASPSLIFNDQPLVYVTISGTIKDSLSGVDLTTAKFAVLDEYGRVQPSGQVTIASDGSYSFTVGLRTFIRLNDTDGRQYTIRVRASDNAGNSRVSETSVSVRRPRTPPCSPHCI